MQTIPEVVFKAMADQTRQRALAVLCGQELSVSELVEVLGQPQSTVSRHLRVLREAGLIRDRRNGATVLYSLPSERLNGEPDGLTQRLLSWVAEQPLAPPLKTRLERIMARRRQMSDRFFDRIGSEWESLREQSFGNRFYLEALPAVLPGEWTVADIGTGTGYLLGPLARQFSHVIAVDPVDAMLDVARQRVAGEGLENVAFRRGDLSALPIADEGVDLAVAMLVIHHVPNPKASLGELYRVLSSGGHVLIVEQTAHENEAFHSRMQDRWWGFDPPAFCDLLREVGFAEVHARMLATIDPSPDAPALFVVTGRRPAAGG